MMSSFMKDFGLFSIPAINDPDKAPVPGYHGMEMSGRQNDGVRIPDDSRQQQSRLCGSGEIWSAHMHARSIAS